MPVDIVFLRNALLPGLYAVTRPAVKDNLYTNDAPSDIMVEPDFTLDEIERAQEILDGLSDR